MNDDKKLKALQIEFDEILTCIKPIYLNWKIISEKSTIAAWIRKLTNLKCTTVDSMHLRNLYILALFDNISKDVLLEPFNASPPNNELSALPAHLKEAIDAFALKTSFDPDWLREELIQSKEKIYTDNTNDFEDEVYLGKSKCVRGSDDFKHNSFTPFDSMSQAKMIEQQNNGSKLGENYRTSNLDNQWIRYNIVRNNVQDNKLRDADTNVVSDCDHFNHIDEDVVGSRLKTNELKFSNKVQEKEMERRLALLQNSYHEDIMKMRSQHDTETQSLINRKTVEMEQLRKDFNEKINEQEYQMDQLETKANECMKQLQLFQENKLKEIDQLKKNNAENLEEQNRHHEQKILNLYEDFQKEKKQLISDHTKKEDALNKETQDYFSKIKIDFAEKTSKTSIEIMNLEKDMDELKTSKNKILDQHEHLNVENQNLITEIKKLEEELNESQKRYIFIEGQHRRLTQCYDQEINAFKETYETALHNVEYSKDSIEAKAKDKTTTLKKEIDKLEKTINDLRFIHKNEIEQTILNNNSEKSQAKQLYDNDIEMAKSQMKKLQFQFECKIQELEKKIELNEIQFNQMEKDLLMKDKITTQIVDDLRKEMTLNNERQLRKKQFELEKIETELKFEIQDKSKEVTDLMQQLSYHKQETEIKLSEIRKWSDNQISVLTMEWKQEKSSIERDYESLLLKANESHRKSLEIAKDETRQSIDSFQCKIEKLNKCMENQKSDYENMTQTCKKQITDLVKSNEDEREKLDSHNYTIVENLNQHCIDLKFTMEKKHADQITQILSKTNEKLKEIEHEYGERSLQSFKMINDLKIINERLKNEKQDGRKSYEEELNSLACKYHSEIENYKKIIKTNLETYKKELINEQGRHKELEKLLESKEHGAKRQLFQFKSEFETKISNLLPLEVQIDLEETIQSLRCQISFLKQRILILEDEVDTVNIFKSAQNSCYLQQKCDNLFEG